MINGPKSLILPTTFYSHILQITNFDLNITVKKLKKYEGYCSQIGKRSFEVVLNKKCKDDLRLILSHEMVHVEQYLTGKLVNLGYATEWQGVEYTDIAYINAPWEIDANGRMYSLYQQLISLD